MEKGERSGYPSDVTDEEWAFVAPYLTLCREDAEQRESSRVIFRRRSVCGAHRRAVALSSQRSAAVERGLLAGQRWIRAGCLETIVEDLRLLLREFAGRKAQPTAMILDSRTLQSTPESGARGGYDGAKRRKGSKVHAAVDTLGHLLALHVTPAEQDRAQVGELAEEVHQITGDHVELAYVDQGYTGEADEDATARSTASAWKWSSIRKPRRLVLRRVDGWWKKDYLGRASSPSSQDSQTPLGYPRRHFISSSSPASGSANLFRLLDGS